MSKYLIVLVFILSAGFITAQNVGIGTTTPDSKLTVAGNVNIGGVANHRLKVRHIDGKKHNSTDIDHLYLNYNNGKNVYVGHGTDTTSSLSVGRSAIVEKSIYVKDGWVRVYKNGGLYFQDHGGGFHMIDTDWIRTYGGKNFYHSTGIMRTDGAFQVGPSGNRLLVNANGSVGIGTTTPDQKLTVVGNVNIGGTANHSLKVRQVNGKEHNSTDIDHLYLNYNTGKNVYVGYGTTKSDLNVGKNVYVQGYVGINTATPDNELDVNGKIRAKEVLVESGWSDYVFFPDYQLPTLTKEEQFIAEHGHLSGFESEQAMGGQIQLGDVTNRQQAKIEEMMLHLIQINKNMEQVQAENQLLKKENSEIKESLEKVMELLGDE